MRRLEIISPNSSWSDFVQALIRDLAPLGHAIEVIADSRVSLAISECEDHAADFWDAAHDLQHKALLVERSAEILTFESEHSDVFVQMPLFQPSVIQPLLEIVDFKNRRHLAILRYLSYSQSVTSRMLVGRKIGLLIWDAGQTGHTPLIGAAVLASPRFSQRIRDAYLEWQPDYPKTSRNFDETARAIRLAGLNRMMQLSVACAMPPYNVLSGAWLAALAPFTPTGQLAFERSVRNERDPDLAAVVTTTGKGVSGSPFRNHRIGQLSNHAMEAAPGASGDVYAQIKPSKGVQPLRASFERLLSAGTRQLACEIFKAFGTRAGDDQPVDADAALDFVLKRLKLDRTLFAGNEMGVHIGMLGRETFQYLSNGTARPTNKRPRLDWDRAVAIWTRKFLPTSAEMQEVAEAGTLAAHNKARRKKHDVACAYPQDKVKLSHRLLKPFSSPLLDEEEAAFKKAE